MRSQGLASAAGITIAGFEQLLKGESSFSVASNLEMTTASVQDFINGYARSEIAYNLGVTRLIAQELRDAIGKQGAIGLIIGLLFKSK